MNKFLLLLFGLIITSPPLYPQQKGDSASRTAFSILFIGNSLTYHNDLPKLVKKSAKQEGIKIRVETVALPDYAIVDHWNDGKVQKLIASKKYDFVIIQQGPSSQAEGRKTLIDDGEKYSNLCKANNAKLCYLMVWPSISNLHTFDGVITNHKDAAMSNDAILLPVGEHWKEYMGSTNSFEYYGPDGFHPSLKGSQVAAKIIVDYLFDQ